MRADSYLARVRRLDAEIDAKIAEWQRVYDLATRITPMLSDTPRGAGGAKDKIGEAVSRLVELELEIVESLRRTFEQRNKTLGLLDGLSADAYSVLHRFYVQGQSVEIIAAELSKTERQIYRIKAHGLRRVQAALDAQERAEAG